ncbi:hypothetical protein K2173_012109 [Erythroxylum novogranatense]|uniref:Senescence regulator n=1 Tax=Erythroxylum novogranatense TaxID=1862640 RepID=A0AAV8SR54_9ROSI|nr:hypothetical protein K2173_012109 [Erythroxylum novogranatense]
MDPTLRHRFLAVPSSSSAVSSAAGENNGDELNEDDILWTNDFSDQTAASSSSTTAIAPNTTNNLTRRSSFPKNSGILAALPESNLHSVLYRKPLLPTLSKAIPAIPKSPQSEREYMSQSMPVGRKLNQSAPMNVPLLSIAVAKQRNSKFREDYDDDGDGDDGMLPPHELVARGSRLSPKTTFSVLEGAGRTLKGRDLRQVRNAVWRQTGFLD